MQCHDAGSKLIKKDEPEMTAGIKNGKHGACNMYIFKYIFLVCMALFYREAISVPQVDKKWVIVIDPGHGGLDPGALGSYSSEKDVTLAIALKTGNYIEQNIKNANVIYTRKGDEFVDLKDRAEIANKVKADLFLSIHANWASVKNIHGTETYVMGPAKDEQNLQVAMKENEVILLEKDYSTTYEGFDPKSPESYVMFSLMQNIFLKQSTSFASKIQTEYTARNDRFDRGVKQAGFWVLFMTTMPSVLTETGFISNPAEEKYLNSNTGQEAIASSIFRACNDYIADIESRSSKFPVKAEPSDVRSDSSSLLQARAGQIIFMIQITSSISKIDLKPENFKGFQDVVELNSQNQLKYATGAFTDYMEAVKYRKEVEAVYPDAFVIAVKDSKILPLQQALDQKKEILKHDIR